MAKFKGIFSIVVSPFTEDGKNVDFEDLRNVVDLLIAEGVDGLVFPGVGSEFYKLADTERTKMIETVVEQANKRVPVIANITRNAISLAVKDAREAEAIGVDGIMIVPPWFIPPSNQAIVEHVHAVADSVELPVIIQYAPSVTGVNIPVETFLDIVRQCSQDFYIKAEAVPPGDLVSSIIEKTEGKMGVFTGNGCVQMYDMLERGAMGHMPGSSMARPYVEIYRTYTNGDKEKAFELFNKFLPVLNLITQSAEMFVQFEKKILKERGVIKSDCCRKPHAGITSYGQILDRYDDYMKSQFGYGLKS